MRDGGEVRMIWFLLFLAVLGIAWFLFVPRTGENETPLSLDGERPDDDQPDTGNVSVLGDYQVGAHATGTVGPSLTQSGAPFTSNGTADGVATGEASATAELATGQALEGQTAQDTAGLMSAGGEVGATVGATADGATESTPGQGAARRSETGQDATEQSGTGRREKDQTEGPGWLPENYEQAWEHEPPGIFE